LEEERVVSEDWVVRYKNRVLQLERQTQHWAPAKSRVVVRQKESGEIAIYYRQQRSPFRELPWASKSMSEGRGAASSPAPHPRNPGATSCSDNSPLTTRLAANENAAFFMGVVNYNQGTLLLWTIWGHF
jgi:hypothetical protein